jgi:hypothetical protein
MGTEPVVLECRRVPHFFATLLRARERIHTNPEQTADRDECAVYALTAAAVINRRRRDIADQVDQYAEPPDLPCLWAGHADELYLVLDARRQ